MEGEVWESGVCLGNEVSHKYIEDIYDWTSCIKVASVGLIKGLGYVDES